MINHATQFHVWNRAAQIDRVPVLLVHVIAGLYLFVTVAQIEGALGIAFQVHPRWNIVERGEGKDLAAYFEDENVLAERRALRDVCFR